MGPPMVSQASSGSPRAAATMRPRSQRWVDGNTVRTVRHFEVYGTGQPIPLHTEHVGTFFDGPFVWHVYEIKVAS